MDLIREKQPSAGSACNFTPSDVTFLKKKKVAHIIDILISIRMYVIWVIGNIFDGQTFAITLCQQVRVNRFHLITNSFSNKVSLQKLLIAAVSILIYRSRPPTNL